MVWFRRLEGDWLDATSEEACHWHLIANAIPGGRLLRARWKERKDVALLR